MEQETIPCQGCDRPTTYLGTKLCDPCWNIRAADVDPRLARAAGELLEACKAALYSLEGMELTFGGHELVRELERVIAKAEGAK